MHLIENCWYCDGDVIEVEMLLPVQQRKTLLLPFEISILPCNPLCICCSCAVLMGNLPASCITEEKSSGCSRDCCANISSGKHSTAKVLLSQQIRILTTA